MSKQSSVSRQICAARALGFTLIELLITVAIVSILAAIAYPSYVAHVTKTYRNSAKGCLSEYAQYMERYYTTNMKYSGANPTLACSTESDLDSRYTFTLDSDDLTDTTYTVIATPIGVQLAKDTQCGTLTIDETGTRTASGSGGVDDCW